MVLTTRYLRRERNEGPFPPRPLDYDSQPLKKNPAKLFRLIGRYLRRAKALTTEDLQWLDHWLDLLGDHDCISLTHSCTVAVIAFWFARERGHSLRLQAQAFMAGALHDIGKLKVPRHILRSSRTEWERMDKVYWPIVRDHVWHGYYLLRDEPNRFARTCALVALLHHQDQIKGYPHPFLLLMRWLARPLSRDFQRILFYPHAADQIVASGRGDQDTPPLGLEDVVPEAIDLHGGLKQLVDRDQRMRRLIKHAPRVEHLIRQAFEEGVVF